MTTVASPTVTAQSTSVSEILSRIDAVLKENRRTELVHISLTIILFLLGIACFIVALATREFAWSSPSAITTLLLYWPLKQISRTRLENIAVATAPILITQLPPEKAAEEIQRLIQRLYGDVRA